MKRVLILQNIRSIHNVGAMFRTADGAGFDYIFCGGYTPTPEDPRMNKVALGAEQFIAWEQVESVEKLCENLKKDGFLICALETGETAEDLFSADIQEEKIALIFGHEVDGVSPDVLKKVDRTFEIPMRGKKESLNVSVAAGVAMYEVMRKITKDKK